DVGQRGPRDPQVLGDFLLRKADVLPRLTEALTHRLPIAFDVVRAGTHDRLPILGVWSRLPGFCWSCPPHPLSHARVPALLHHLLRRKFEVEQSFDCGDGGDYPE